MTTIVLLTISLLLFALTSVTFARSCSHDQMKKPEFVRMDMNYHQDVTKRQAARANIRFIPVFDWTGSSLKPNQQVLAEKVLVPQSLAWLSERLKVTPVQGPLRVKPRCSSTIGGVCVQNPGPVVCGETTIPSKYYEASRYCPQGPSEPGCVDIPAGSSTENGDYLLAVNAVAGSCEATTLAFAAHCAQDQDDRPILGYFTLCPLTFAKIPDNPTPEHIMSLMSTVVHEICHALGFTRFLFPYYRDLNNQPRVPRDERGVPLPGQHVGTVVSVTQERGHTVTKLITPAVVAAVRDHFNCNTMTGGELEDQGGAGSVGSHWEERIFYGEFMTSTDPNIRPIYAVITAALFRDSGWYDVDYSQWQTPIYGWKAGCPFALDTCLKGDKSNPIPVDTVHYCSPAIDGACSADRMSTASCSTTTYAEPLPIYYQYFADAKTGVSETSDFCPRPQGESYVTANGRDCIYRAASELKALESAGASSRCVMSTLTPAGYVTSTSYTGNCFPITCNRAPDGTVTSVTISAGKSTVTCQKAGEVMTIQNEEMAGGVVCPPFQTVCPGSKDCPKNCSGYGTCENGRCNCFPGFTGVDCATVPVKPKKRGVEMMYAVSDITTDAPSAAQLFATAFNLEVSLRGYSYSLDAGCINATHEFLQLFPIALGSDLTRASLYFNILKRLADWLIHTMDMKHLNCFPQATVYVKDMTNPGKPALFYDNLEELYVASILGEWSNMGKRAARIAMDAKALRKSTNALMNSRTYSPIPETYTECDPSTYNEDDGCDCECGAVDPDCNRPNTPIYNCYDGPAPMCKNDTCSYGTLPSSWTCESEFYAAFDGCDCGCGAVDPDCAITPEDMFGCPLGDASCSPTGTCIYQQFIPLEWSCGADSFNNSRVCNCGCDAWDPDCDNVKLPNDCPCPVMKCMKTSDNEGSTFGVCTGTCQGIQSLSASITNTTSAPTTHAPTSAPTAAPSPAPTSSAPTPAPTTSALTPETCGNNVININFAGMLR